MQLSKRLLAVAQMVTKGNRLVDAGTDHGYIPIYLVENNLIPSAIAMDINKGPINRAQENITKHNLNEYIETRLSDGVKALNNNEGDTLVIAGMGGGLVIKILTEGAEVLKNFKEFILQPQSEIAMVRKYLQKYGYQIIDENMLIDEGKYYQMFKVVHGSMNYDKEIYFKYGKILLENKNNILQSFLKKELNSYTNILTKLNSDNSLNVNNRKKEINEEIKYIMEALKYYGM